MCRQTWVKHYGAPQTVICWALRCWMLLFRVIFMELKVLWYFKKRDVASSFQLRMCGSALLWLGCGGQIWARTGPQVRMTSNGIFIATVKQKNKKKSPTKILLMFLIFIILAQLLLLWYLCEAWRGIELPIANVRGCQSWARTGQKSRMTSCGIFMATVHKKKKTATKILLFLYS